MATTTNQVARPVRSSFALLSGGFRIFFPLGAFWAILVLALFVAALAGAISLPAALDAVAWHRHEMLFGYLGAIVGGFLLTAIPNWTGRKPLTGLPLLGLAFLWGSARLAVLSSLRIGLPLAILCDAGFLLVMAGIAGAELYAARNRNVPILLLTVILAGAAALDLAEGGGLMVPRGIGYRLGIGVILTMVMLIGGRIIPTFTRNWLAKGGLEPGLPAPMQRFDLVAVLAGAAAMLAWVALPDAPASAWLLIGAGALHLARLLRWRGWRTGAEPLVAILHLAYLWVPVGLTLLGVGLLGALVPAVSGVHALTAGAFATMTLAVMTRASLGHTGRALHAGPVTVAIYALILIAALVRVAAPLLPIDYMRCIHVAAAAWIAAFALFLAGYGPLLVRPRAEDRD